MKVTPQLQEEILKKAIQDYVEKGYIVIKSDQNRALLKRRAEKAGFLSLILGDIEKVYVYVESSGDISVSSILK